MFKEFATAEWTGASEEHYQKKKIMTVISPLHRIQTDSGAHIAASYSMGIRGSEAGHTPPSSVEVSNAWSDASIHYPPSYT
jgi:hypothetical protein